jgi:transposase
MKRSELISLVREVMTELEEANVSGNIQGYTTPYAFGKDKKATKALKRIGYKKIKRPKRPSSTKLVDYLQNENNNSN